MGVMVTSRLRVPPWSLHSQCDLTSTFFPIKGVSSMQWWLAKSHMPDGSLTVAQNGGWVVGLKNMNLGHQDLIIWPLCDATKQPDLFSATLPSARAEGSSTN